MGVIRLSFELIFVTISLALLIAFIPTNVLFADFPLEPRSYELPDGFPVVDERGKNTLLISKLFSKQLLKDLIAGPESIVLNGGVIYTGVADGRIVLIDKKSLKHQTVVRIGDEKKCGNNPQGPEECGRPLGLRLHPKTGNLFAVDPFFGVFEIFVQKGSKELIAFGENDKRPDDFKGLLNDAVFDPEDHNILYVSATTSRWGMQTFAWSLLEHENSGRVFAVDLSTKKVTKILDNLYAPNGVEISPDKKHLLFSETYNQRILKVNLDQIRKFLKSGAGSVEPTIFVDNLPGMVDNIRLINGNIYAPLALPHFSGPSVMDRLSTLPIIRKAIGRSVYLASQIVKLIRTRVYDHPSLEVIDSMLGSGGVLMSSAVNKGAVVVLDANNGNVKQILVFENIPFISEIAVDDKNGDIYVGSFANSFLGKVTKID